MKYLPSILKTIRHELGLLAMIYPFHTLLSLGDYGVYYLGKFLRKGNIFEHTDLCEDDCIRLHLGDSPVRNFLIASDHVRKGIAYEKELAESYIYFWQEFFLLKQEASLVHFKDVYAEQLALDFRIVELLEKLVALGIWHPNYQLVWHRQVAMEIRIARALQRGAKFTLHATVPPLAMRTDDYPLKATFEDPSQFKDKWENQGPGTPAVGLVKFCAVEEALRPVSGEGLGFDFLPGYSEPRFKIDEACYA